MVATAVLTFPAVLESGQDIQSAKNRFGGEATTEFRFEVLSIHPIPREKTGSIGILKPTPNGFSASALLYQLVISAYGPTSAVLKTNRAYTEVHNLPGWSSDVFAIEGRVSPDHLRAWQSQGKNYDLLRAALQAALKDRFKLVLHKEPKHQPILELVIAKQGPRLKAADPRSALPKGVALDGGGVQTFINDGPAGWNFYGASVEDLANFLTTMSFGSPVRDRTGLTGRYDFTLRRDAAVPMVSGPELLDAVYLQDLGLKIKPGTEDRPVLVIDHVERPTQN